MSVCRSVSLCCPPPRALAQPGIPLEAIDELMSEGSKEAVRADDEVGPN